MDGKMKDNAELKLLEIIQANQPWRSTWKAELNGNPCIAKLIDCQDSTTCQQLSASLCKQLRFSEILQPEDVNTICLFNEKVDLNNNQIAFCRNFVDGKPLDILLQEHEYIIREAVDLICKIAKIISKAHSTYKVSHGDLKPANIIIGTDGEPVIIDWDTMKVDATVINLKSNGKTITLEHASAGTPKYMPPEQCRGDRIDEKCDIYALGVILYQLINCGKTPFDEPPYSSMNEMQLMGAKEQPIDSLSAKHPELKVNEDLSNIINKAVAPDRNNRYADVDSIIDDLYTLIQLPTIPLDNPVPIDITPINPDSDFKREKNDKPATNLVLIGHPQSGKTVLAAGLYATSNDDFTVEALDLDTRNQAINTKSIIEKAEWPAKTGIGTIKNLNFRIFNQDREAVIRFDEYAGELLSSVNYFRDVLKQPDGVLILLNAGAPQLHDPLQRNKMLEEFNNFITYLCDLPNHPPIAFVVTASDRLATDLKEWKDDFEKYAGKVTASLQNNKCKWKRFDVSVCGNLEKQDAPKLEPHDTHKPFMWLMDELDTRKKLNFAKGVGIAAMIIALLMLSIAAGRWIYETHVTRMLKKYLAAVQAKYYEDDSKDRDKLLTEYLPLLTEERNKYCTQNHVSSQGNRSEKCDPSCATMKFWYKGRKTYFDNEIIKLEKFIDLVKVNYLSKLLKEALDEANDDNYDAIIKGFKDWIPLQDKKEKDPNSSCTIAYRIKNELEPAHEHYVFADLEKSITLIIDDNITKKFPTDLDNKIDDWSSRQTASEDMKRKGNIQKILDLRTEAKKACELRLIGYFREKLKSVKDSDDTSFPVDLENEINTWQATSLVLDSNEQEKNKNDIRELMLQTKQSVDRRYAEALERELKKVIDAPQEGLPPELPARIKVWSKGQNSLPSEDFSHYKDEIDKLYENAKSSVYTHSVNALSNRISSFKGYDDDLAELISDYNLFLNNKPDIDISIIQGKESFLADILKKNLEKYVDILCDSFRREQMNSRSELKEDFTASLNTKIYPLISTALKEGLQSRITSALNGIAAEWDMQEHKRITDYIDMYRGCDIDTLLMEFCKLCNKEIKNKYLSEAENLVLDRVYKKLESNYGKIVLRNVSTIFFLDFKTLCASIRSKCESSLTVRKHEIYTWVSEYLNWIKDNRQFNTQISDLKIKVNYPNPDDPYVKRVLLKKGKKIEINDSISGWRGTRFNKGDYKTYITKCPLYSSKFDCQLGECIFFMAEIYDEKETPDESVGYVHTKIFPGLDNVDSYIELDRSTNNVMGRLYVEIDGESFDSWLRTHNFPKR